jgi:hypothetical protein
MQSSYKILSTPQETLGYSVHSDYSVFPDYSVDRKESKRTHILDPSLALPYLRLTPNDFTRRRFCLAEGARRVIIRPGPNPYLQLRLRPANLVRPLFNTTPRLFVKVEAVEGLLSRLTVNSQLIDDSLLIRLDELVQEPA